jgi:outer membrane protein OmpA-like peptidoglycan-associated protein
MTINTYRTYLKTSKIVIVSFISAFLLAACGTTTQVILLPNPDGKAGSLEVVGEKGTDTQTLDQPWHSTKTSILTGTLGSPKVLDEKKARAMLAEALAAEPKQPLSYLIYFDTGSTSLSADAEKQLAEVMDTIKATSSTNIAVIGHSDSVGSVQVNDALSLKRAESVVNALEAKGVDRKNMEVTNHGKANPLIQTPDGVAEPRNRRVEVIVR